MCSLLLTFFPICWILTYFCHILFSPPVFPLHFVTIQTCNCGPKQFTLCSTNLKFMEDRTIFSSILHIFCSQISDSLIKNYIDLFEPTEILRNLGIWKWSISENTLKFSLTFLLREKQLLYLWQTGTLSFGMYCLHTYNLCSFRRWERESEARIFERIIRFCRLINSHNYYELCLFFYRITFFLAQKKLMTTVWK